MTATATTVGPTGRADRNAAVHPVTMPSVIRSEWIKFRSLRSSWISMAAAVVAIIGIGLLVSYFTKTHWSSMGPGERARFNAVDRSLVGVNLAQLIIGVMGVLYVSGEYGTGMIRSTLSAVPTRIPVIAAKSVVFAIATFCSTAVATVIAFTAGQALLGPHGVGWGAAGAVRAVIGAALYLTLVGLFGLVFGFLVRSTAGGIGTLVGVLLVLPGIFAALPASWNNAVGPYLPSNAGGSLWSLVSDHKTLPPLTGFAVFCAWVAAGLVASGFSLLRRDA